MTGPRFSGHTGVRDTPGTSLLDYTPDIGGNETHMMLKCMYEKRSSIMATFIELKNVYHQGMNYLLDPHPPSQGSLYKNQFFYLKYGVLEEPLGKRVKRLSALRPSATNNTSLDAGGASGVD